MPATTGELPTSSYNLQPNWSNAGNWYVLFSTNGTTWSALSSGLWDKANAWQTNAITGTSIVTGNPTVYFRVFAAGAEYSGNPSATHAEMYLDNITISGCPRPVVPTLSKAFSPDPVAVGASSTLTFTVTNPNTSAPLSGIAFTDTLPAGLTVASGTTAQCGGTLNTTAPSSISFSGGSLSGGRLAQHRRHGHGDHRRTARQCQWLYLVHAKRHEHRADRGRLGFPDGRPATRHREGVLPGPDPRRGDIHADVRPYQPQPEQCVERCCLQRHLPGVAGGDGHRQPHGRLNQRLRCADLCAGRWSRIDLVFRRDDRRRGVCTATVGVTAPALGTYSNTSGNVSHVINAATVMATPPPIR